jgi:predicted nucleic acid-binding protein
MILVDTSVWIDHLRKDNDRLRDLLLDEQVFAHPFVIGELACGNLRNREEILGLLAALPQAEPAQHEEVLRLLDAKGLGGKGLGWVDAHLLASAMLSGCTLWTLDKTLHAAAVRLKISA